MLYWSSAEFQALLYLNVIYSHILLYVKIDFVCWLIIDGLQYIHSKTVLKYDSFPWKYFNNQFLFHHFYFSIVLKLWSFLYLKLIFFPSLFLQTVAFQALLPVVRDKIIDGFSPKARAIFQREFDFFDKVTSISGVLFPIPKEDRRAGIRK